MCRLVDTLDYKTMMSIGNSPVDNREIVRIYSCGTVVMIESAEKNLRHECEKVLSSSNGYCQMVYENKYFRSTRVFLIDNNVFVGIVAAVKYVRSKQNIGLKEAKDLIESYENVNFLEYELIERKMHLSQELSRVIRLNAREIYNCDPSDMSISIKFDCDESEYLVMVYRNKGCMLKGYGYTMDEAFRNCLTEFCVEVDKRVSSMRERINSLENSIKPFKD